MKLQISMKSFMLMEDVNHGVVTYHIEAYLLIFMSQEYVFL